jgi:hypothetical protein
MAAAQSPVPELPRADVIEFYGLRQVSASLVTQALGVRPGSPLPPSKGEAEERINQIDRIAGSWLEAVCCFDGKTVLYVGIEERDAAHYEIRQPPGGAVVLPDEVIDAYQDFRAARQDPAQARERQELPDLVAMHLDVLRAVLRESSDELQRAAAAYLLAYAPRKLEIVDDLRFALGDADPVVRATAVRSLTALAALGKQDPSLRIRVDPAWFVDMLHSLAWSDRMEASRALDTLTQERDEGVYGRLRQLAMDELVEMARWKTAEHALPPFRLLGRIAGLSEQEIQSAWTSGGREQVISAARRRGR